MINSETLNTIYFEKLEDKESKKRFKSLPAVFFDRDGVILKERNHLKDLNKVELENGVKEIMEYLTSHNTKIILITNQSGINRGEYSWKDYELVTKKMLNLLGNKVKITAIYANSEDRYQREIQWRKPNPNMIFLASKEHNIELNNSILIGDRISDIQAGINSNIKNIVHVKTGHGSRERKLIKEKFGFSNQNYQHKLKLIENLNDIPLSFFKKILYC